MLQPSSYSIGGSRPNNTTLVSKYFTAWLASEGKAKMEKIIARPPSTLDLNSTEIFWALLRQETYSESEQQTSLNSDWEAAVAAAMK